MTKEQATWASQHDWFVTDHTLDSTDINGYYVIVKDYYLPLKQPTIFRDCRIFDDFKLLKAWAGSGQGIND